jgi:predicted phage baseplate assembly protein
VCDGAAGNLGAGLSWRVTSAPVQNGVSAYGSNPRPISGGANALDLDALRRLARLAVRDAHAIVTKDDLERAVLAFDDLRVARAEELLPSDAAPGRALRSDVRTLVAVRARAAGDDPAHASENDGWLDTIRRRLVGRMQLGERLRIVAPDYRTLRIEAMLRARPGYSPQRLAALALDLLIAWLAPVADASGRFDLWPLGRAVEALDVRARLLTIDGVASIVTCSLLWDGDARELAPPVSRAFVPLFSAASSRVTVEASAPGARR